jgi:hypothetical protein
MSVTAAHYATARTKEHINTHIHKYIAYIYMRVCTYIHTHTHIHTYIHTNIIQKADLGGRPLSVNCLVFIV